MSRCATARVSMLDSLRLGVHRVNAHYTPRAIEFLERETVRRLSSPCEAPVSGGRLDNLRQVGHVSKRRIP